MNGLDIFVIVVIIIGALYGFIRGFVITLFGLTSTLIIIILSIILTPKLSGYVLENTSFDVTVSEKVVELLDIEKIDEVVDEELIDGLTLPPNLKSYVKKKYYSDFDIVGKTNNLTKYIGDKLAQVSIYYLSFVALFLAISLIVNLVVSELDLLTKLPVLKQLNALAGLVLGSFIGVIVIYISCLILSFVLTVQATDKISILIEESIFLKLFFYSNPIGKILEELIKVL